LVATIKDFVKRVASLGSQSQIISIGKSCAGE